MLGKNVNFMKQNDLKILQKIKEKLFSQNCFSYEHIFQIHHCILYPQHKLIITAHENIKSENEGVKVLG